MEESKTLPSTVHNSKISIFIVLQEDLKYEYTTCDDNGGRWKVEVPIEPGKCSITSPKAAVRGKNCGKLSVARSEH